MGFDIWRLRVGLVRRGFTLIELLITLTVLAILVITIVVILDPGEIFKKTRDTRRFADLQALRSAISFGIAAGAALDLDGSNQNTCSDETGKAVYVSIPSAVSMHLAPTGWSFKQAPEAQLGDTDGGGWVPIDFTQLPGGSPLFNLPLDPRNEETGSSHFFYSYGCAKSSGKFELNARLESESFGPGGKEDRSKLDGGDVDTVYETGTDPKILPTSGVY